MSVSANMMPASGFKVFEGHVRHRMKQLDHQEALVSVVFAPPAKVVFSDLTANYDYLDLRSGQHWDLYFAGYDAGPEGRADSFRPERFIAMVDEMAARHAGALARASDVPPGRRPWRYSGGCDLVSLMVYRRPQRIVNWDWLSLRGVTMTDSNGAYVEGLSLSEVTETARRWRDDPAGLELFGPGEAPVTSSVSVLGPALASLGILGTGIAQNAAYDLLKRMAE